MKKTTLNESEKDVQRAVIEYLQLLENMGKVYFFRNNSFEGRIERPGGSKGYIKNNKKGVPDIVCCYRSRFIGLEIKGSKGKQSEDQQFAEAQITFAGGKYYIIRSLDDAKEIFEG